MRDPKRIRHFLDVIARCWEKVPDWRFMQLMCNIQAEEMTDCFYREDEEMLEAFKRYFKIKETAQN